MTVMAQTGMMKGVNSTDTTSRNMAMQYMEVLGQYFTKNVKFTAAFENFKSVVQWATWRRKAPKAKEPAETKGIVEENTVSDKSVEEDNIFDKDLPELPTACVFLPKGIPKESPDCLFGKHDWPAERQGQGQGMCWCFDLYGNDRDCGCAWFVKWQENLEVAFTHKHILKVSW